MKYFTIVAILASVQAVQLHKKEYPTKDPAEILKEVKPLQWCPDDSDEKKVLKDGNTPAVSYPERGYNCKQYDHALGPNKLPYEMGWYHNE